MLSSAHWRKNCQDIAVIEKSGHPACRVLSIHEELKEASNFTCSFVVYVVDKSLAIFFCKRLNDFG